MSSSLNTGESSDVAACEKGENVRNEIEENKLDNEKEMLENPQKKDILVPNTVSERSNIDVNPQAVDATKIFASGIDKDQSEFPVENKSNDMPDLTPPNLSSQNESFLEGNEIDNLEKVGSRVNDQPEEEISQSEPIQNETAQENGEQLQQEGNHQTDTYEKNNCTNGNDDAVPETSEIDTSIEKVTSTASANAVVSNTVVSNECNEKESHAETNGIDNQEDAIEKNIELEKEVGVETSNDEENVAETKSNGYMKDMIVPSSSQQKNNDLLNNIGVRIIQDSKTLEPQRDESRNVFEMHHDDDLPIGLPLLSKPEQQDSMSESSSFKAAGLDGSDDDSLVESGQSKNSSSNHSSASSKHTNPDEEEENKVEGDISSPNKQSISDNASDSTKSTGGQQCPDASISSEPSGKECMNVFDDTDENRQLLQDAIERMIEKNVPIFNVNTFRLHNKDLTSRYSKESLSAFLQCQLERMDNESQEGWDQAIDANIVTPPRNRSKAIEFFHDSIDRQQIVLNAIHELKNEDLEVSYENLRRNYHELTTKYTKSSLEEFLERYDHQSDEGLDLIGAKVAKYFGDKLYRGEVIAFNGEYWRVRYEDDDEEDYNREEIEELMKLFDENRKKKKKCRNLVNSRRKDDCKPKKTRKNSRLLRKYLGVQIPTKTRELLSKEKDWMKDMEYYFSTIEGNSEQNVYRVMSVVKKLVAGHGVVHPQTGGRFLNNVKIHLGMDFEKILNEANAYVDKNGGDRGHGWLIQHPVGKLLVYQHTRVENGNKPFRTLLGTGSISSGEDESINSGSNIQVDASSGSDEDYEESRKTATKSTLDSWIIKKPPNLCGRRKRSTLNTSEEGLTKLKLRKLSQDPLTLSQARKFMDDMESKGVPLNYKNFEREYPNFTARYPRKSISAMLGHRRSNSMHAVESDDSDIVSESETGDKVDTQASLKESCDIELAEPHDSSTFANDLSRKNLTCVESNDEAKKKDKVEEKEESFYALKGYLLTEIMSSETSYHEKKEVDEMFTSYADKFIQDGFHCPAILKAMNDMGSNEIDEYLSNTIGMKFAHKLQFKRWLASIDEE